MKRNFEKLILNTKIIYCSNLSCDEEIIHELSIPFEKPKTIWNKDGNGIKCMIIRANDFIRIITEYNQGLHSQEVWLILDQLNNLLSENNDIWIGLD